MFDLSELLRKEEPTAKKEQSLNSVLFYRNQDFANLAIEAFRFEGFDDPAVAEYSAEAISKFFASQETDIVLLELTQSSNVVKDAKSVNHMLPSTSSVIVVGMEDSISTLRQLRELGFYYMYWPFSKQELMEFVTNVTHNRQSKRGVGQKRKAKHVAIVGCKGGVGNSMISAEVAFALADMKKSSCVLVNHNYDGGNLDVMLGKRDLKKRRLQPGTIMATLDSDAAWSLLTKVEDRLDYLALESDGENDLEIRDLTESVVDLVARETHFVLEDLSASVAFRLSPDWLCKNFDCIVLVMDATVSALRKTTHYVNEIVKIRREYPDKAVRLLVVMNYTRPEKTASVSVEEITKYLGRKPDVTLPYYPSLNNTILQGEHMYQKHGRISQELSRLAGLITGESTQIESNWIRKLLSGK
ncbi:chromosome partitioning protein ParA [Parasalinivibrio latis]|uniref:AAA family ATPase n=1 Tax=Parasalinivibrio latis TaxID=2952610 RepID=UPI0030E3A8F2